ncbi:MAG: hypothetical protein IIB27_03205, partial [Chloroflexi bacterium]|nr:hypothetical protein [Chloroflexota bacterium]
MKLITALAVFVLLVVGFVGLTSSGSTARADVDAKVYVANEWSNLTNDPTPMSGYTFAGSGKSIYSTFVEVNDATGVAQSTIAGTLDNNANRITIFVEDADVNEAVGKTLAFTAGDGAPVFIATPTIGDTHTIILPAGDSPIVDADGDGLVTDDILLVSVPANALGIQSATAGGNGASGIV